MMQAYFDDSGTHAGSPVVVIGGMLGESEEWSALEDDWNSTLRKLGLSAFHASDCASHRGEFANWPYAARLSAAGDFREVLERRKLVGFGVSVDTAAWNEVVKGSWLSNYLFSPFYLCLESVIQDSVSWMADHHPRETLHLYFDDRDEPAQLGWDTAGAYMRSRRWGRQITAIAFMLASKCPGIQVADLLAYNGYEYHRDNGDISSGTPAPPLFKRLLRAVPTKGCHFDADGLRNLMVRMERSGIRKLPPRWSSAAA